MRSQLTRHVFRQIIYYTLYSNTRCCARSLVQSSLRVHNVVHHISDHRRNLFGFSRKATRTPKPANLDPGFGLMLELKQMLNMGTRPPLPEDMAKAFNDFFQARLTTSIPLEAVQVRHAMTTFTHLRDTYEQIEGFGLTDEDLRVALGVLEHSLARHTQNLSLNLEKSGAHNQLAKLIFEELKQRRKTKSDRQELQIPMSKDLLSLIRVLSLSGDSLYARGLVESHWDTDLVSHGRKPWLQLLKGFAREDKGRELEKTVEIMENYKIPFDYIIHQSIILFYVRGGDMEMAKKWYEHPLPDSQRPTAYIDASVLRLCIRKNELEWGDTIFKSFLEKNPETSEEWDIIFQWAAAKGKGVDEIERMMKVMVRRNEENEKSAQPNIETINGLVELANSKNDPYTAERYIALGQKWGFRPNAETYLLQLDYRISVGDLDGAKAVYIQLQAQDIPENKDVPLINRLIVALCGEKQQAYETIMGLVEDLSERKVQFALETVASLTRLHLQRGEMHDLVDLLHTHSYQYGVDQRATIRDIFVQFCLDGSNSTNLAWDAYSILRQIFAETDVEVRTKLMNEFFRRQRSDMACHVFGHMRQQPPGDERPTTDTYVSFFEGIARSGDLQSLETVHNMLKLDPEIEPNTKLYNSLMLAFTGCKEPRRALEFWKDIVHSREGPTYNSIHIALRACEVAPFGDRQARDIWARLKRYEIEVSGEIYTAYIGALAGQALFAECTNLIDKAEKEIGYKPDAPMMGTFYNAIPGQQNKEKVEEWASKVYPSAWQDLSKYGWQTVGHGMKLFKIQRDVKA